MQGNLFQPQASDSLSVSRLKKSKSRLKISKYSQQSKCLLVLLEIGKQFDSRLYLGLFHLNIWGTRRRQFKKILWVVVGCVVGGCRQKIASMGGYGARG